jgi:hypothetical protein
MVAEPVPYVHAVIGAVATPLLQRLLMIDQALGFDALF